MNRQLEKQTAAAAALGVSLRTFYRIQDDKALGYPAAIFIHGRKLFDVDERIAWIKKQKELQSKAA